MGEEVHGVFSVCWGWAPTWHLATVSYLSPSQCLSHSPVLWVSKRDSFGERHAACHCMLDGFQSGPRDASATTFS